MRIGIDARFYGSLGKGLGRYTEKLIAQLEVLDQENDYVIFLCRENYAEYQPKNPRFSKILAHYTWYSLAEQLFFPLLLYRLKFDLVHFPHFNVPILYRRHFVVTIHDLILLQYPTRRNTTRGVFWYHFKYFCYRVVIASAIARADHILTVSHFTEGDIIKHYPRAKDKITVTYEAADLFCQILPPTVELALFGRIGLLKESEEQPASQVHRDILKPYLLYVGNAYPHKNLEILLTVAKNFPEYLFVLVGKGDYFYTRLRVKFEQAGIKNVIFAGFITESELGSLYHFATLYIFPSLYEGFGLPPLEAMTRGLPVLSSRAGSLPEILGDAACYFDARDALSFTRSIGALMNDAVLRATLSAKGYVRVAQFSFRAMAFATHTVYQKIFQNQ